MIVVRFKATCRPDRADEAVAAFQAVVAPSRTIDGVVDFDIGRDVTDPHTVIATEVFEDEAARERQESLPEVATVMSILPDCLAAPPEATVYEVTRSYEPSLG
jgi:quinol monooxygenase YgiN